MARRARKASTSRHSGRRGRSVKAKRRGKGTGKLGKYFLPCFLSFGILVCLSALGFIGFQTAIASQFFDVSRIEVDGVRRSSKQDIERLVSVQSARSGVWSADLRDIKARIEKLPFVRTAAVSRILPNGIRVTINEREPRVIARMSKGDYLVDEEGIILARAESPEPEIPFVMLGWDEAKSPQADKDNLARVKMFQKMVSEWQQFDLASRVRMVSLADLTEPRAFTEDSGQTVTIALGRDNFGEQLKRGIGAIAGKGATFNAVNLVGQNMILSPRK